MKLLITGDFHRDLTLDGYDRYDELTRAIQEVEETVIGEDIDVFVFLGDLTDPDSPNAHRAIADTIGFARRIELSGSRTVKTFWIPGNHDIVEDGRGTHTLLALREAGFTVVDEPLLMTVKEKRFLFLPYTGLARRYDPLAFVKAFSDDLKLHAVFGHCTRIPGHPDGSETTDMHRGRDLVFPTAELKRRFPGAMLFNGHYHRRHLGDVMTPGALARCTHGEADMTPGYLLVTL